MKKYLIAILTIAAMLAGCAEDDLDRMESADVEALKGLELAYENARVYNDSLIYCEGAGGPCSQAYLRYCDSIYHHNEYLWNYYHDHYNHFNHFSDHFHNQQGMHRSGQNQNRNNDAGHYVYHHEEMERLMSQHGPCHP